ncbi:muramidase family protein [Hutsoniella sourekii]|uniref:muramidase family protein n=1 Tax=Hutsoniella sourekii TaxID=87650 RepID=UPI000484224F|nr:LysM peptidoglycan-binding domain-containing protein [Hutsoniella sourekii]
MKNIWTYTKRTVTLLASLTALLQAPAALAQQYHTVQGGEYLLGIANAYGVSVGDLMEWNGLTSDYLDVGMTLNVDGYGQGYSPQASYSPSYSSDSATYVVQPGDTLSGIAAAYGTTVDSLMAANGLSSSYLNVGDQLAVAAGGTTSLVQPSYSSTYTESYSGTDWSNYYTVSPGDTLSGIAAAYGTTVDSLMAQNGLGSTYLNAGDVLYVPNGPVAYAPSYEASASAPTPSSSTSSADTQAATTYVVQAGDNINDIAQRYGVSASDILTWNGLASDYLYAGQELILYPQGPVETSETITIGQTDDGQDITLDLSKLPEAARPRTHIVKEGDNVWRIAQEYNVSAESLRIWNNLKDDQLTIGQRIYVSNPAFIPSIHLVKPGENLDTIAQAYQTSKDNIVRWNNLQSEEVSEGTQLIVSDPDPKTHQVVPGERLEEIAETYQVTVEDLRKWNKIPSESTIINGTLIVSDPTGMTPSPASESSESSLNSEDSSSQEAVSSVDETEVSSEEAAS